jgi:hypothetical protein
MHHLKLIVDQELALVDSILWVLETTEAIPDLELKEPLFLLKVQKLNQTMKTIEHK